MDTNVKGTSLRELAQQSTTLCALMEGRNKIDTADIMKKYPDGFTVTEVAFAPTGDEEGREYPVVTIAEDDTVFYCGGQVLNNMFANLCDKLGGLEDVNAALAAEEGLKMRLEKAKSKNKREFTKVIIL